MARAVQLCSRRTIRHLHCPEAILATHLYVAPAASGKTTYVLARVMQAARDLQSMPRVIVAAYLQARAWKQRLAEMGGAIGVRVMTFDELNAELLSLAGETYSEIDDAIQYRLIRSLADHLALVHFSSLKDRPGFIQALQGLFRELKAARILPEDLARAVDTLGQEPRLVELAQLYRAYQERLRAENWADYAGLAWLAVDSLERSTELGRDWPLLVVDGFDDFTQAQLALLQRLAGRVNETLVTLTGALDDRREIPFHRLYETRCQLESALNVRAEPLLETLPARKPALAHLEHNLYRNRAPCVECGGSVDLIEAPNRSDEVRAALRWLKERIAVDGMRPGELALLARSMATYRPLIVETAAEFALPVRLLDGVPLRSSPVIAALVDMVRLMLPRSETGAAGTREPALPPRLVVEAWRSPYLDWNRVPADASAPAEAPPQPVGIVAGDAEMLDRAARWGRVIGGWSQWEETLRTLAERAPDAPDDAAAPAEQEQEVPANIPHGGDAQRLLDKLRRFVARLTPPPGANRYSHFVGWLETLIGADPVSGSPYPVEREPDSLQVVARVRDKNNSTAEQDLAALETLKDVLRGLVWAEQSVADGQAVDLYTFFTDLVGAIDAATYRLPARASSDEIQVTALVHARGVPFRAVAVLGLAEGEFPASLHEDPFLRDADRAALREQFGFPIDASTESVEIEYLYTTLTRAWERLLLTRPRLADNGAAWQASPYWEEVRRLLAVEPVTLTTGAVPGAGELASLPELLDCLSTRGPRDPLWQWAESRYPEAVQALTLSADVFVRRNRAIRPAGQGTSSGDIFDGDLTSLAADFAARFKPSHVWSASRLESYRTCPFMFLLQSVLGLEAREEPVAGLDVRQLGNIYHRILAEVYQTAGAAATQEALLGNLETVAEQVLQAAPKQEGFRETAWWQQTRLEIVDNLRRTLCALTELPGDYRPLEFERRFERPHELVIPDGATGVRVHGVIDRIDRDAEGNLRIIDYKTGGPSSFDMNAIVHGKKLQVPLYALAAEQALRLGTIGDGFYWHVVQAEPSGFSLERFKGGPSAAIQIAVEKTREAVHAAREGRYEPAPPDEGCPAYCVAAAFCWHYEPRFGY